MSVLIDTNVLVGAWLPKDELHRDAVRVLDEALQDTWGTPWISDYILDEAVTLALSRTKEPAVADALAGYLLGEPPHTAQFEMAMVSPQEFRDARATLRRYHDRVLSFTDCVIISTMQSRGIDTLLSADAGFDGIVRRIDPRGEPALA